MMVKDLGVVPGEQETGKAKRQPGEASDQRLHDWSGKSQRGFQCFVGFRQGRTVTDFYITQSGLNASQQDAMKRNYYFI
jgi:hypothetical protein